MFNNQRYISRGVKEKIPIELQIFIWECIDRLAEPKDYFQIFDLKSAGIMQGITHRSEEPEYRMEYLIVSDSPINDKLYVIDNTVYTTMILAEEY